MHRTDELSSDEAGPSASSRSRISERLEAMLGQRPSGFDLLVVVVAGLFTVAWMPVFVSRITPRVALVLLLAPVGLLLLLRSAFRTERSALVALAAIGSITVSALVSPDVLYSLKGGIAHSSTVVVVGACLCWWPLGRALSDAGSRLLPWALVGGLSLSALVAALQVGVGIDSGPLATFSGRGSGLFDNPVYYGSVMAGIAAWAAARAARRDVPATGLVLAAVASFAAGLSGSRVSTLAVIAVVVVVAIDDRSRRSVAAVASVLAGLVASSVYSSALSTRSTVGRLTGGGEGPAERLEIWSYGMEAFLERPFVGWGLNHFGTAIHPRFTPDFVRSFSWDSAAQPWTHPHNLVVFLLVSVGLVGTSLLCWFAVEAIRGARDRALLAAACAIGITWMFQPTTVDSMPLALLLLGAAVRPAPTTEVPDADGAEPAGLGRARDGGIASWSRGSVVAVLVGTLLAGYLLIGDHRLHRAADAGDARAAESAAEWFYRDPYVSDFVSSQYELAARRGATDALADSVRWARRSVDIAPHVPILWDRLAARELAAGEVDEAGAALQRALELLPVDTAATTLMVVYAGAAEDDVAYREAVRAACRLELDICDSIAIDAAGSDDR